MKPHYAAIKMTKSHIFGNSASIVRSVNLAEAPCFGYSCVFSRPRSRQEPQAMQDRNVLSLIHRLVGASLGAASLFLCLPAGAQDAGEFPLLSYFSRPAADAALEQASGSDTLRVLEVVAAPQLANSIDLTRSSDNLWDRLRNGFAMTDLNDEQTLHYQQWYQNRPDALRRMVERSRPFLHHIVQELEMRGMPTEIALLPMVESSFNPMAYSHAHAAGLWQFIPATGKRFNLEQNWWQDQRRDIVASTSAALDYLQTIYDMHGDWHLALASYNWGEGAVKRAVDKNLAKGMPTDYASLTMPNETRNYVPKLQALKNIFGNPALMAQLGLPEILNRPYFVTIDTEKPMDVKTAARLANMPVDQFVALNPSHNRPIIKADTAVVLPADKLDTFRANLNSHSAPLSEWQTYTLKSGEKLQQIAPRFGMPLAELLRVNGLSGRVRLGAGSTLLVNAGEGGNGLGRLGDMPDMPRIIEVEAPRKASKSSRAKGGKTERLSSKSASKSSRSSSSTKKAARSSSNTKTKQAATKPKPNAKVAKSGNGGRG